MITGSISEERKTAALDELRQATTEFLQLVRSFDDEVINTIPPRGGWTVAQVAEHVTLSNHGMIEVLRRRAPVANRSIDEGEARLKDIFLNFEKQLQSPDFIRPTREIYEPQIVIGALAASIEDIVSTASMTNPDEVAQHAIFGEISKFEIVRFVTFHTQRHSHQLKKIAASLAHNATPHA
jgi:hypothetical protein